eukprot:Colp12_sorted_trinity150504_noHs@14753
MNVYTGSTYQGERVHGRMEGKGTYNFSSGVRYEGDMKDGEFHGHGTLFFENGGRFEADWSHGLASNGVYTYKDGLVFESNDWSYCTEVDRRFYSERVNGLKPAGESQHTDRQPTPVVPSGTYDVGDGYYDPETKAVWSYDGETQIRIADTREQTWA